MITLLTAQSHLMIIYLYLSTNKTQSFMAAGPVHRLRPSDDITMLQIQHGVQVRVSNQQVSPEQNQTVSNEFRVSL